MTSPVVGWTESRFYSFLRSGFRKMHSRYPPKYKCLAASKEARNTYRCAECNTTHGKKNVAVDHIIPCGTLKKLEDIQPFIEKMFYCGIDGLQVLCKECHYTKTMHERGMSDEDIKVAAFKKLPAKEQKEIVDGKNLEERIINYRKSL